MVFKLLVDNKDYLMAFTHCKCNTWLVSTLNPVGKCSLCGEEMQAMFDTREEAEANRIQLLREKGIK